MKNMVFCLIFGAESRGTKMPRNADLIILETYVQQGTYLITRFSYMSHNVTKCAFLAIGGGGGGAEHVMSKVYKKHIIGSHI